MRHKCKIVQLETLYVDKDVKYVYQIDFIMNKYQTDNIWEILDLLKKNYENYHHVFLLAVWVANKAFK
jgi:hypothetical protein